MTSPGPSRLSALLNRGVQLAMAAEARRFERAALTPEQAQRARLSAVLEAVRGSKNGRALSRVTTAREFQDALPISTRETVRPLIDAVADGELQALTREAPVRFELSGGSSGASRYVPITRAFLSELHRALAPWLFDLLTRWPALRRGPAYWSISPIGTRQGRTKGGTPIGSESDASYFPAPLRPLIDRVLAVPGGLAQLPDVDTCRYVTLRCLLERGDVAFVSCWNPSFLTLLLEAFDRNTEALIADLREGACRPPGLSSQLPAGFQFRPAPEQAARLSALGRIPTAAALFPNLALVSTWTDAEAARALPALRERLGGVEVQGKGLLATEGVITFPLRDAPAPVLAVRSHFYEFVDPSRPDARPLLAHELEAGREYDVLLSTSAGLLRYRLGDRVRVAGFFQQTPCLTFVGRSDAVVDLVGEKVSAAQASEALSRALEELGPVRFALLAPEWTAPPAYHLHVDAEVDEGALSRLATRVDAELKKAHPYGYARRLGQLGPVVAHRVRDGQRRYEERCILLGQRAGDIKPTALHRESGWSAHFGHAIPLQRTA